MFSILMIKYGEREHWGGSKRQSMSYRKSLRSRYKKRSPARRGRPFPSPKLEKRVWDVLLSKPDGTSISAISIEADLARETVVKYLELIRKKGRARLIQAGMTKWYKAEDVNRTLQEEDLSHSNSNGRQG
jgi:hypothetical protein